MHVYLHVSSAEDSCTHISVLCTFSASRWNLLHDMAKEDYVYSASELVRNTDADNIPEHTRMQTYV